jgi:hemolysin III
MSDIHPFLLRHPVSAATHLLWCLWALYATALLWRLAGRDRLRRWSVACFGLSMVLLYAASGAYHAVPAAWPTALHLLRLLDYSAIYVLIAGTYTPMFAVLLTGWPRPALLALVWGLALAGIASKWLLPEPPYEWTIGLYVAMGSVGLLAAWPLTRAVGARGMGWALLGGLIYSTGAVCEAARWPVLWPGVIGPHEILHLCDMAGTATHVFFVVRYVLPHQSLKRAARRAGAG